jgi:TPR repeat protein
MSDLIETSPPTRRPNPLIWIGLIVVGLILYIFVASDRGMPVETVNKVTQIESSGEIERSLLIPPGMRAREYIAQIRAGEKPYPMTDIINKAAAYQTEGSLADAHLLYFFSAREGYLPATMKMAEMADPAFFRAEDSLLDQADAIQAYKWYQKAATMGHEPAVQRVKNLQQWAETESKIGNPDARQLMLNFK